MQTVAVAAGALLAASVSVTEYYVITTTFVEPRFTRDLMFSVVVYFKISATYSTSENIPDYNVCDVTFVSSNCLTLSHCL